MIGGRKKGTMKFQNFFCAGFCAAAFLSAHAYAASSSPVVPLDQELTAVDYAKEGRQSGCGLRITAQAGSDLWVNVLLSVFVRESAAPLGMFKVVVKKINMENGQPLLRHGKITYSSIGQIHRAWLKSASGVQLLPDESGGSPHGEGYMTSTEFMLAMKLLSTIMQENFSVGFSKAAGEPDVVFEFNKRITPDESGKLTACMQNLRATMEEQINRESF